MKLQDVGSYGMCSVVWKRDHHHKQDSTREPSVEEFLEHIPYGPTTSSFILDLIEDCQENLKIWLICLIQIFLHCGDVIKWPKCTEWGGLWDRHHEQDSSCGNIADVSICKPYCPALGKAITTVKVRGSQVDWLAQSCIKIGQPAQLSDSEGAVGELSGDASLPSAPRIARQGLATLWNPVMVLKREK